VDDAAAAFRRAVSISPDYAEAHHNLGMALGSAGDADAAESEFREALRYRPDYALACVSLAAILHDRGDHSGAEELCRKALSIDADGFPALCLLALSLRAQHRDEEALQVVRRAVEIEPADTKSRLSLGNLLLEFDRWRKAAETMEQIVAEHPLHVAAQSALTNAYLKLHCTSAAIELCRKAIAEDADFADGHCNLGVALRQLGDIPAAIEAYQSAIRIEPEFAEAHNNLGIVYMDVGDMERARESFREAIKLDPGMGAASLNLSRARRMDEADLLEISRIEALLEGHEVSDERRIFLHFALGKMFDDCARYDQAFEHFGQANRLKHKRVRFDAEQHRRWSSKLIDVFAPAYFEGHAGLGVPSERPVFIVGMPRSGTTLVEQILASHPEVYGGDELTTIYETVCGLEKRIGSGAKYPEFVPSLDETALQWGARQYIDTLQSIDDQAARVTDKMPSNFLHLGIIAVMLPGARVIHCRRDAMDVCLSNFVQLFANGHYYSYDLSDIAVYYRGYEQIMSHWRAVLPIRMYEVQYEELVEDQERISRELVDYIGLDWDDRCLAFHETERAVRTASNWQVRQPIYKTARNRWKNYENHLTQLKADLGYVEDG